MAVEKPTNHGSVSKSVPNFNYTKDVIKHPNVTIGDFTYGNPQIRWLIGQEKIEIGKFCSFAGDVSIYMSGNHPIDTVSCYPFPGLKDMWPGAQGHCPIARGDVVIGNDVWVGWGAKIMSGVTIGDGAVIGAHSIVAKDVEPYAIAVGSPCREVKKRFDDKTIAMLQEVKWWDWSEEKIQRNIGVITSKDIWKIKDCQ
jgi:acetyltransferase-like isoleucine patch superfamily enzyme